MEEKKVKCPKCNTEYNEKFLIGKQGNADVCPMCGANLQSEEEHSDWITWYYYGNKSNNGKTTCLCDQPIDLDKFGVLFYLIKEFKAPPRDVDGNCDAAKQELKKYVPDAFVETKKTNPVICCPRCGSTEYTLLNRGYSIFTGFLGSGKVKRVCNRCKREF